MVKINFRKTGEIERSVEVPAGTTLMEAARDNNVAGIVAECGGACACATCHVYVDEACLNQIPKMEDMEQDMLEFASDLDPLRSRLSCQIQITEDLDDLTVQIPANQG